jgi:RNA polymerase sigma-70 factor (ECF subfamily)
VAAPLFAFAVADRELPTRELDDRELVARASREPNAFDAIYRRHVDAIYGFVLRRCGDAHLAEDVTATVFERAWRNIERVNVESFGIAPWLYRIAANELASQFRKRGRGARAWERLAGVRTPDAADPSDELVLRDDIAAVMQALGRLRPRHQEVITLRFLAGLSPNETAAAMDTTPSVVAALLHRAMRALERAVGAVEEGDGE